MQVPASTSNLGPGFDAIGLALNLYNFLELEVIKSGLEIRVEGEGVNDISTGSDNIAYQAIQKYYSEINESVPNIRLMLKNQIPIGQGLGSSGATRIAALLAANAISGNRLSSQEILNLSVELEGHTGNSSPALFGGLVVFSKTNNGGVKYIKLPYPRELKAIVAIPEVNIGTPKARSVLPAEVKYEDAVFNICRSCLLLGALAERKWNLLYWGTEDKLHQPYREKLLPGASEVLQTAVDNGADGACWSGAGASMIAFARKRCEEIGQAMVNNFASFGINSEFKVLEVDERGAKIMDECEEK